MYLPGQHLLQRHPHRRYRYVRWRWRAMFAVIDFVGGIVFGVARAVRGRLVRGASVRDGDDPRVILLVQLDHLGDAVLTVPMLSSLRRRYPQASIEVLAGPWNHAVFEAAPEVDRIHVSRVNRFARDARRRLLWIPAVFWWGLKLRRRRVDLAIDVRGDFAIAMMMWLAGARRRLGWACGGGGFLLTEATPYVHNRPEIASRMALLGELGIESASPGGPPVPSLTPPEPARRRVKDRLAALYPDGVSDGPLWVFHVGAGTRAKRWPVEYWRRLIDQVTLRHGGQVVLVGGPGDRITGQRILGNRTLARVADWTGQLNIVELAALLEQADLFVGADSGPAHLAAAVGAPVVVLFSGTNRRRQWQPRGPAVRVVRHAVACSPCHREVCPLPDHPCMRGIRPGEVAGAVAATWPLVAEEQAKSERNPA